MAKYTAEREREIRGLLTQLERSGQSVREFARKQGVSTWTVHTWRKRFGFRPRRVSRRADLVEIRASDVVRPMLEIVTVRVPSGFDDADLARVLRAVRGC